MFLKINVNFTVRLTSRARLMRLGENGRGFVRLDEVILDWVRLDKAYRSLVMVMN